MIHLTCKINKRSQIERLDRYSSAVSLKIFEIFINEEDLEIK